MFTLVKDINVARWRTVFPALLTIIVMPLTYSITNGIGGRVHVVGFLKVVQGKWREIHPLMGWSASRSSCTSHSLDPDVWH
jgi:AGZA family xanthine/uracil permease-like MFS transporter